MITLTQLVSFVLRYRRGTKAFRDNSVKDIESLLGSALAENLMVVDVNIVDEILGLVIFEVEQNTNIHIVSALVRPSADSNSIHRIVDRIRELYGSSFQTISFRRRGKERIYYLNNFLRFYGSTG